MTLVGAFQSSNRPVLLGDFLITRAGAAVSLRKKLRRFSDSLVVGWTGDLVAAELTLGHMEGALSGFSSTRGDLTAVLTGFNVTQLGSMSVSLTGWLIEEGQPSAFKWDSSYPHQLFWGGPWYLGSGGPTIERIAGPGGFRDAGGEDDSLDRCLQPVISAITTLLADEMKEQANRRLGFGHAYEVLYWSGERFEYLDDVLYLTVMVEFSEGGQVESLELRRPCYKYLARGEYSVVAIAQSGNELHFHVNTPVGYRNRDEAVNVADEFMDEAYILPLTSMVYSCFIDLRAPGWVGPMFTLPMKHDMQPNPPIFRERRLGELEIRIPIGMLSWGYKLIREDQEEKNRP